MKDKTLKLKKYIEEISLIQENDFFDLKSIRECINYYDLTDDEQDQLRQICLSHTKRSEELLLKKNLRGAIASIERAVEINPLSEEFRNKAAQLYLMRSKLEGFKKSHRDLAYNSAALSLTLNKKNPIASSILKEIRKRDNKINGKDLNKNILIPITILIIFIVAAVLWEKEFTIPFFMKNEAENDAVWVKAPQQESIIFTEQNIDIKINNRLSEDFNINLTKSIISKINGSYSYTIQGEIQAPEKAVKSADLNINFISNSEDSLFKKSFPLVREDQIILPGEPIIIDEFFYIHYLPPDINRISFNLTDLSFSDDFSANNATEKLYLQWDTPRPDGINFSITLKNKSSMNSYSGTFQNIKIELKNQGAKDIFNLKVALSWKDKYGNILLECPTDLIHENNPSLTEGKNRIYYLFSEITEKVFESADEFYITINGIN